MLIGKRPFNKRRKKPLANPVPIDSSLAVLGFVAVLAVLTLVMLVNVVGLMGLVGLVEAAGMAELTLV